MEKYTPEMYFPSIDTIPYERLLEKGITHLLFDLDNTVVPAHTKTIPSTVKTLFESLKEMGFTILIFSNSPRKRLLPFGEELEVEFNSFSMKPFKHSFHKVLKKYGISKGKVVIIGDQILTDIVGGNKMGIHTILITPLSSDDILLTKINRLREKRIFRRLEKEGKWKEGEYDE